MYTIYPPVDYSESLARKELENVGVKLGRYCRINNGVFWYGVFYNCTVTNECKFYGKWPLYCWIKEDDKIPNLQLEI